MGESNTLHLVKSIPLLNEFHVLYETSDFSITGNVYPQTELILPTADQLPEGKIMLGNLMMEVEGIVKAYRLVYRAKLTDYLSGADSSYPVRALISTKFYELLRSLHAPAFHATPACVIDRRKQEHEYVVLHQPNHLSEQIDYKRSVFTFKTYPEEEVFDFQVDNYAALDEFIHARSGWCRVKHLYLCPSVFEYDFFTLWPEPLWLISADLRERLLEANISGIVTMPFVQGDGAILDKVSAMRA